MTNRLAADLDHVLAHTGEVWERLRGARIFITGGTGFFGHWLLETFLWANRELDLGATATVLTRDPEAFRRKAPHLAGDPAIALHGGDVRDFAFPSAGFSHLIHGATAASARMIAEEPLAVFDTIVAGTRRALDFSASCGAVRFLMISSGAVYGNQPPDISHLAEDYTGAPCPLDPGSAYGEGKRTAELLCTLYRPRLETVIARPFAFAGPYLPLDTHFAIGNFIGDALAGRAIRVRGNGTPVRSYLYAADLAIWLWTMLVKGRSGRAYNVGSESALSVAATAQAVAAACDPAATIEMERDGGHQCGVSHRYVPSTARAREELGLSQLIPLEEAIRRTMSFYRGGAA